MSLINSTGDRLLRYPRITQADVGDLYIHAWGDGSEIQMWCREKHGSWKEVNEGYTPTLPNHCLYKGCNDGRMRWVQKTPCRRTKAGKYL
jgi:hypothetical protein